MINKVMFNVDLKYEPSQWADRKHLEGAAVDRVVAVMGGGAQGKPTRRGRGAQIQPGETTAAWDQGVPCWRQSASMEAGSGREAELNVTEAIDGETRRHGIQRRAGTDLLTNDGARRCGGHDCRDSCTETRTSGGTLATQSEGEKRREGVARSAWRHFLSSRSAGAGLPNG